MKYHSPRRAFENSSISSSDLVFSIRVTSPIPGSDDEKVLRNEHLMSVSRVAQRGRTQLFTCWPNAHVRFRFVMEAQAGNVKVILPILVPLNTLSLFRSEEFGCAVR